jgi:UDP-2-acetamido-3-amino-2,3-dideoxy-glucuronate N-acetyltransferase
MTFKNPQGVGARSGEAAELQVPLKVVTDARGNLVIGEVGAQLPFTPARFFTITNVPANERRAQHAHHRLEELFVCLKGSFTVTLDDGTLRQDFVLDRPDQAVYKPPMYWVVLHSFSADALALVLASEPWDDDDHIKDYQEFVTLARAGKS